jgi:hypothetical protein
MSSPVTPIQYTLARRSKKFANSGTSAPLAIV